MFTKPHILIIVAWCFDQYRIKENIFNLISKKAIFLKSTLMEFFLCSQGKLKEALNRLTAILLIKRDDIYLFIITRKC